MSAPKIRYQLNMRAVLIMATIGLAAVLGLYVLWGYEETQILKIALDKVREFQKAAEKPDDQEQKSRNNDLALRHLRQYLEARPDDIEGLDIEAKLLLEARDLLGAASVYEHLIRAAGRKDLPDRERELVDSRVRTARHRLAEIYIAVSDAHKNSLMAKLFTKEAGNFYRYHTAELHAKNLLRLDETAPVQTLSEDAKAHLLYASALEGQIVSGQTRSEHEAFVAIRGEKETEGWKVSVEDGAILEYENALELMDKKAVERMEKARNELVEKGRNEGYDLRLMSWRDGSGVPTSEKNLVIVGADNNGRLHIRIFDVDGKLTDTDETKLPATQAGAISTLKQQLSSLLPPHAPTGAEKVQVISEVASIISQTLNEQMRDDIVAALRLAGLYQKASRKTPNITEQLKTLIGTHKPIETDPKPKRPDDAGPKSKNAADNERLVSFLRVHPAARRLADLYQGSQGYDLRLMSWGDGSGVPARGKNLVIVGTDNNGRLHIRTFDADGKLTDTDETKLPTAQARAISTLKQQLPGLLPPHALTDAEKAQVISEVTSNIDLAKEVLDRLLEVHDSVEVRTARYTFFSSIGDSRNATAELEQAILLDPDNLVLILTAAENAMRSGAAGAFEPHFWLDQIPRSSSDDPRVLTVQGMVQYTEQKYEAALATWKKGLKANPSDLGLSQRLALVLLELGRDDEAAPIVTQYSRLVTSKTDPLLQFLEGIQDEHAGRFSRAIDSLESARGRLPESFQTHVHLILARCQEKQGDFVRARETYRAALALDPKSLALRQFLGRLLLATQPEEAAKEFEKGLESSPNQPALLLSLAEARLLQQRALPQGERNWADFDAIYKRAKEVAPSSISLALLNAERLASEAGVDKAVSFLWDEVKENPKSAELAGRLAEYLRAQGRVPLALEVLTKASDPGAAGDRGSLRVQRALVLNSLGQGREARNLLLRDVNQLPPADRDEVWTYLFLLSRSQGDPETTRAIYNEWGRLLPDDPRPKFALLEMDIEANDQKAIHDRLKSLTPHNDQGDFFYHLVQARQKLMEAKKSPSEKDRKNLLKDADDLVEKVLRDFKIDTVALLLKGQILEAEGAAKEAADFYNQAWARGNVDALVRLVEIWTRLGRKPELDRLRQDDKTKQLDFIVATAYLRHGARSEAVRIARQSLAENPGRPTWQVGILEYLGKNEEAGTSLRTLAEQQSDKLEPWLALVRFHATQHRAQTATEGDRRLKVEAILEEIEPLLKGRWSDELLTAECRFAAADWSAADKAFDAALKRYPDAPEVQAAATRYQAEKGRPDAAEACLSRLKAGANIAKFKPLLKDRWPDELLAAECHFAAADWPAADKAFDAARKRYPEAPEVQAAVTRYQAQKGRPDAAKVCLRRLEAEAAIAVEIKPRLKNRWSDELLAAECRFAAADWPAADKAFDAAVKRYPDAPEVQAAATRYQAQKGRPDAAEACLRRLKVEATIAEAKQRVKLPWPELIEAECRWAIADWPAADKAFDAAANRYPDARDVQLAASRYYEERGRLDVAEACLRRMLDRNPDERGAARELAMVLSSQGDRPGAWKQALELLGPEGPKTNTPEERLARAIVLGRSRDLDQIKQAIGILQVLLSDIPAESPMVPATREMLTRFLLAAGQADQASKVAGFAAARGRTPAAIALYAEALLQSRQFDAAEEQRKRLEQIDPENPLVANLRARLILARSKSAEAAAALEKAYVDLAKENNAHAEQFGREAFPLILGLGPNAQGVAEELASRLAKQNPALSWMKASILARQGKRDEALALCRTSVEAGKNAVDSHEACRVALEAVVASRTESMALKQAEEILEAALQGNPEADDLLIMKAMINHLQSRFDEELRLYRLVLEQKPRSPVALNNIAWVLSEGLHQPAEALEKIDEVIQLTGRTPNNVDTRGTILMRLGRLEQAIDELKWVIQAEPTGVHYYHLARAYRKMGRDADFQKAFEEAKRAGLTSATLDGAKRADFEDMLKR